MSSPEEEINSPQGTSSPERDESELFDPACFRYDELEPRSLLNDLRELPPRVYEKMLDLLRRGYPSPFVANYVMAEPIRGGIQQLEYGEMLYRVEYLRRCTYPEAAEKRRQQALERAAQEELGKDAAVPPSTSGQQTATEPSEVADQRQITSPQSSTTKIPDPSKLQYDREHARTLLREVRQLPGLLLDIATCLLLAGETSEGVTELLLRRPDRGGLQPMRFDELLYRVELLSRYVRWLEAKWSREHAGSAADQDALADYLRRKVRGNYRGNTSSGTANDANDAQQASAPPGAPPVPELFYYEPGSAQEWLAEVDQLPPGIWTELIAQLRAGDCSEKVTKWLMNQPSRGALQQMDYRDLVDRIECKRRFLFYGFGDPLEPFLKPERTSRMKGRQQRGSSAEECDSAGAGQGRSILLWGIAQLPDLMLKQFVTLLMEGGSIADRVLRISAQLNRESTSELKPGDDRQPDTEEGRPRKNKNNPNLCESSHRAQKGDGMLRTLGKLKPFLLAEAIKLLAHGAKGTVVARFLLSREDLGECPRLRDNSMRQYLQYLKVKVLAEVQPPATRKRFLHQVAKHIQRQQLRTRNMLLMRQALPEREASSVSSVPEVASLPSIKASLMELFWSDPSKVFQELTALRRTKVQASVAS